MRSLGSSRDLALGRGLGSDVNMALKESAMRKLIGGLAVVAFLAGVFATPAAAQLFGNATYAAMPGTGVTIAGDYALSLNDDAKYDGTSTSSFAGGRIALGLPMFGVWAGAGAYPMGVDGASSKIGFGGGVGVHVLNKAEMPVSVSVEGGFGYYKQPTDADDFTLMKIPFGLLLAVKVPTTGVGVTPWIYPRGEYVNYKVGGGSSNGKVGFGVSGGLMVTMPMGLGLQATLDWMSVKADVYVPEATGSYKPLVASFGLHYMIKVPSLGM
jgi:hypothetical protein